jgi:hypothetical protein
VVVAVVEGASMVVALVAGSTVAVSAVEVFVVAL